jgi:hypothetical protein
MKSKRILGRNPNQNSIPTLDGVEPDSLTFVAVSRFTSPLWANGLRQ